MRLIEDAEIASYQRRYYYFICGKFRCGKLTEKQKNILNTMRYDYWYEADSPKDYPMDYMFSKGWLMRGEMAKLNGEEIKSCEDALLEIIFGGKANQPMFIYKLRDRDADD